MAEPTHQKFIWKLTDKILDRILPKNNSNLDSDTKKISTTKLIILIIFSIVILDYFLKFSENFVIDSKVKNINNIESVVKSKSLDSIVKNKLLYDQRMISSRHSWQSRLDDFISFIQRTINSPVAIINTANANASIHRSDFWHIISSSWVFIFVVLIAIIAILFAKGIRIFDKLFILLMIILLSSFSILGISYIFALIPTMNPPFLNYIINAILNLLITILIVSFFSISEKRGYLDRLSN